jgi:hypothetical protein
VIAAIVSPTVGHQLAGAVTVILVAAIIGGAALGDQYTQDS